MRAQPESSATKALLDPLGAKYGDVQLALLVEKPPPARGWSFELKFDGYRILALKSGSATRLLSRSRRDWSAEFVAVADAVGALKARACVIDGEVCALNAEGASSFQLLQNRGVSTRIVYFVFDCLMLDGVDLRARPIEERRAKLATLVNTASRERGIVLSAAVETNPQELLKLACEAGLEGIVAKAAASPYVAGRTRTWLKIKCAHRQEFAIVGWLPLLKTRPAVGSLILALKHADGAFRFAGKVGTGFTEAKRRDLVTLLQRDESATPTAKDVPSFGGLVHFVNPRHVAEVSFTEWTDGGGIRHPSFQGLRADKTPDDCTREVPAVATSAAHDAEDGAPTKRGRSWSPPRRQR